MHDNIINAVRTCRITSDQLRSLTERAYLNGIAAAGIAHSKGLSLCESDDFKKSTAFYEMERLIKENKD